MSKQKLIQLIQTQRKTNRTLLDGLEENLLSSFTEEDRNFIEYCTDRLMQVLAETPEKEFNNILKTEIKLLLNFVFSPILRHNKELETKQSALRKGIHDLIAKNLETEDLPSREDLVSDLRFLQSLLEN